MKWIKQPLLLLLFITFTQTSVANAASAKDVVNSVNQRIMQSLRANKASYTANPSKLNGLVQRDLVPFIDFTSFSKLILGTHWKTATAAQQQQFIRAFQGMLMRTYTKSLLEFTGSQLTITREVPGAKPKYAKVYGKFSSSAGKPKANVIFEMKQEGNRWKAYNITVNAFSLVKNFRTSFGREINQFGLDGLIKRLSKNQVTE